MSEIKHTQGLWRVREVLKWHEDGSSTVEAHQIVSSDRTIVVDVSEEADARLIAAAPELLEALKSILQRDPRGRSYTSEEEGLADIAIAKAEGRP